MSEPSQERLGILDCLKMVYDGHPEFSLLAVKAPIDETVQAFIEFRKSLKTRERMDYRAFRTKERKIASLTIQFEQNIPIVPIASIKDDEFEWAFPFLQVRGSEWTVIFRSIGWLDNELEEVRQEANALSARLQTKAITLMEEDTSVAIGYELFEKGELVEEFEEAPGFPIRFMSKLREKPDVLLQLEENDEDSELEEEDYDPDREYDFSTQPRVQFINAFFSELGIYLPACYAATVEGKPALAVEPSSENRIERADWVSVKETLEENRQEPDPDDAE